MNIIANRVSLYLRVMCAAAVALCLLGTVSFAETDALRLPSSVTKIEKDSFEGCENVTRVVFSQGTESIGDGAFASCSRLTLCDMTALDSFDVSVGQDVFPQSDRLMIYVAQGMADAAKKAMPQYESHIFESDGGALPMWLKADAGWKYLRDADDAASFAVLWQQIDGKKYYFDATSGIMRLYWQEIGSNWYYLGTDGVMRTGWQEILNDWYYFGTDGAMRIGWQEILNDWYYFDASSGILQTGWKYIDGNWYYLNETSGIMQTGWVYYNGGWYYCNEAGIMLTGRQYIDGTWYEFDENGKLQE